MGLEPTGTAAQSRPLSSVWGHRTGAHVKVGVSRCRGKAGFVKRNQGQMKVLGSNPKGFKGGFEGSARIHARLLPGRSHFPSPSPPVTRSIGETSRDVA